MCVCVYFNGNSMWYHWEIRKKESSRFITYGLRADCWLPSKKWGGLKLQGSLALEYILPIAYSFETSLANGKKSEPIVKLK